MFGRYYRWKQTWRIAQNLNRLRQIVNDEGKITIVTNGRAITLKDTRKGYRVSIASEKKADDPLTWAYYPYFDEAFEDLLQTAYDIDVSPRLWHDGTEFVKVP